MGETLEPEQAKTGLACVRAMRLNPGLSNPPAPGKHPPQAVRRKLNANDYHKHSRLRVQEVRQKLPVGAAKIAGDWGEMRQFLPVCYYISPQILIKS